MDGGKIYKIQQTFFFNIGTTEKITSNLYLLNEKIRFKANAVSFRQIDKAVLPPEKVRNSFLLQDGTALTDNLDERRVKHFTNSNYTKNHNY